MSPTATAKRALTKGTRREHVTTGEVWRAGDRVDPTRIWIELEEDPRNRNVVPEEYWLNTDVFRTPKTRARKPKPPPEPEPPKAAPRKRASRKKATS